MHIGFLTPEYPTETRPDGGLGNYVQKVAFELKERGHKVTVFMISDDRGKWQDEGINIYKIKKAKFHWRIKQISKLSKWLLLCEWLISARRAKKLILDFQKKDPLHILQTTNFEAPGLALCNNGKIPIICRCSSYATLGRSAVGNQRSFSAYLCDWIETRQVLEADAAFSPSEFIANIYDRFEGFRPELIRTPIDKTKKEYDQTFYMKSLSDKKYLLYFGGLSGVKGVDNLIQLAPRILDKYVDMNIVFIGRNGLITSGIRALDIIHDVKEDYKERIFYSPPISKLELFPIIQNSLGVVMPSRVDNYPNACLETFSLGVPVIGTYNSSLDEIIIDGETGFLARNDDPDSLLLAICSLIDCNHSKKQEMKRNIQKTVNTFNHEDRIGQHIKSYNKVIKGLRIRISVYRNIFEQSHWAFRSVT